MGNSVPHPQKTIANELLAQTNIPLPSRRNSKKHRETKIVRQSVRAAAVADRHWQERAMESIG